MNYPNQQNLGVESCNYSMRNGLIGIYCSHQAVSKTNYNSQLD